MQRLPSILLVLAVMACVGAPRVPATPTASVDRVVLLVSLDGFRADYLHRPQGNRAAGIGVQFSEQDGGAARGKIETYLAGALKSDRQTHTM